MKCFKCGEESYGNICRKCEREEDKSKMKYEGVIKDINKRPTFYKFGGKK